MSGDPSPVVLPDHSRPLLEATRLILATDGLPPVVLIGGLAVTVRVSAVGTGHRATGDVDFVTVATEPPTIDVIADAHHIEPEPLMLGEVKVDLIATSPVTDAEVEGLTDKDRLFVAGHRWAFESATRAQLTALGSEPLEVSVGTPAGLVATKSHAVGYPSSRRRTTKTASDLLDLFRLVESYNRNGELSQELLAAPAGIARLVALVAERQILASPIAAAHRMSLASLAPIDVDPVRETMESFVEALRT